MTETLDAPSHPIDRLPDYDSRRLGFAAGVVAAAVMLVAIGVLRALSGATSLPEVVAEGILVMLPGALFSAVLDSLQHAAKPLFYLGVAIGMLIVGGLLGRWYGDNPSWRQAVKIVLGVWLVFGLVVYTILGAGLFGQHLAAGPIWHGLSLLLIVSVYGLALVAVHGLLVRRALPDAEVPLAGRRDLLRSAGVAALAVVASGGIWRVLSGVVPGASESAPVAAGTSPSEATAGAGEMPLR